MAVFSVEIADEDVSRVLAAIAANYKRPAQVVSPTFDPTQPVDEATNPEFVDNPETIPQFANRIVRQFLAEHVASYEADVARKAAVEALNTSVTISDPAV